MKEVTDPFLLEMLNGTAPSPVGQQPMALSMDGLKEVTDQEILKKLQNSDPIGEPQDGFVANIAKDFSKRGEDTKKYFMNVAMGKETLPGAVAKTMANTAIGGLNNVIGEGIWALTPNVVRQKIGEGAQYALDQFPALRKIGEGYQDFEKNNPRSAEWLAALGNTASLPVLSKGANVAQSAAKRFAPEAVPTSDEIRALSNAAYQRADNLGGLLTPKFSEKFVQQVKSLTPQTTVGKLVGGKTDFTDLVDRISQIHDKPISLRAAQEVDELLSDEIDRFVDKQTGRLTKEGKKIAEVQDSFRKLIENADHEMVAGDKAGFEALKEGRKLWSAQRRMGDIERIISRAEMMDNPATSIRSGFRNLASNPSRLRSFAPNERELIRKAADAGPLGDTLRIFGSRLIPIIAGGSGAGLPSVVASHAASAAARNAASALQVRKAEKVFSAIAKNTKKKP